MFDPEERDRVRARLLDLAESDPDIAGAAITGSHALGHADRWSDLDLAFAVTGPVSAALERWTRHLTDEFAAQHHWDLPSGRSVYRVFLLPHWLEVDIAFTPADDFGPRGPLWRTVFGDITPHEPAAATDPDKLIGLAWHHALHSRICIERDRQWQAQYWIGATRDQVLALSCLRLGLPTDYAKGVHLLPDELTEALLPTLVRSLDEPELRRALAAVVAALDAEVGGTDPAFAQRLRPMLAELLTAGS